MHKLAAATAMLRAVSRLSGRSGAPATRVLVSRRWLSSEDSTASSTEFHSVEKILREHLPPKEYEQAMGVLQGLNGGQLVKEMPLPAKAAAIATENDFDVHLHKVRDNQHRTP